MVIGFWQPRGARATPLAICQPHFRDLEWRADPAPPRLAFAKPPSRALEGRPALARPAFAPYRHADRSNVSLDAVDRPPPLRQRRTGADRRQLAGPPPPLPDRHADHDVSAAAQR